jgi:hypothetical protein
MNIHPEIEHDLNDADLKAFRGLCEKITNGYAHRLFCPKGILGISLLESAYDLVGKYKIEDRDFREACVYITEICEVPRHVLLAQLAENLMDHGAEINSPVSGEDL